MAAVRKRSHLRLIKSAARAAATVSILLFFHLPLPSAADTEGKIFVTPGKYGPYYHVRLQLKAAAIDFAASDHAISSGGQFEIRLKPEYFPVPAPNCRGRLILRMPWNAPDDAGAKEKIAAKEALLKKILALEQFPQEALSFVVELNPYVEVVARDPLRLRLTQCNVFFRHAFGAYVDHTAPLNSER